MLAIFSLKNFIDICFVCFFFCIHFTFICTVLINSLIYTFSSYKCKCFVYIFCHLCYELSGIEVVDRQTEYFSCCHATLKAVANVRTEDVYNCFTQSESFYIFKLSVFCFVCVLLSQNKLVIIC